MPRAELARALNTPRRPRRAHSAPDSYRPWPCMVLSVDPGEQCGVAVHRAGLYVDSGNGDGYDSDFIGRWIDNAAHFARSIALPLVLVLEKPPAGGRAYAGRNLLGSASVIGCRKQWLRLWTRHVHVRKRHRCDVLPQTWRSRVLGVTQGPQLELHEMMGAARISGRSTRSRDEAAAILIGQWASRAAPVGAVLVPASRKAAR